MQPLDYIKLCLTQKFADFNGRARRSEYWWFFLFCLIVSIVGEIVDAIFGNQVIGGVLSLAILIPSLSAGARRLHDTNRSGWWQLIALTGIGIFILIYWWAEDSDDSSNEFGPNPKTGESDVTDHLV